MSVGYPTTKADVDNRAGMLAMQLRDVFENVQQFKAWLDTQTSQDLIDRGYVQSEVDIVKSAYTDLDKLRQVYEGTQTQDTNYDFRTFARQLTGVI